MKEKITIVIPTTPERRPRLQVLLDSIYKNTKTGTYKILIYENLDGGWVKAVHNSLEGIDGLVILLGSDTTVEDGWLEELIRVFWEKFPKGDGIVEPYNEFRGDKTSQHPFGMAETIRRFLYREYIHNFSDDDMTDCLKHYDLYAYAPRAIIRHHHMINGQAEMDETYKTIFNKENWAKDEALYKKRVEERARGIYKING